MIEGGAAGTSTCAARDRSTTRACDSPIQLQGLDNSDADDWGARGSLLASATWGNDFGVLARRRRGAATRCATTGFETIGWTNAEL